MGYPVLIIIDAAYIRVRIVFLNNRALPFATFNCKPLLKNYWALFAEAHISCGLYSNAAYIAFLIWSFWNVWNWSIWSNTVVICKGNYVRKDSCSNSYSLQILSGLGPEENCPVNVLNDIYQLFFLLFASWIFMEQLSSLNYKIFI